MLTETGYLGGLGIYVLAAILALVLMNLWLLKGRGPGLRALVTLPLAALLLTPAYIEAEADTFAPALIVAGFQWFSQGPEAAEHALRPLMLFTGVALCLGIAVAVLYRWRQERPAREPDAAG